MENITQHQIDKIDIGRLQDIIQEQHKKYAEDLYAIGEEYDRALEQEQGADTDTKRAFCAGMSEAYKNALAILYEV